MRDAVPKAMFVLLPLFALIVALAFRRRAYIEHLYFALHLHAFLFLVLLVAEVADLTPTTVDDSWRASLVFAATFAYGVVAARRVYAHGWVSAIARYAGVFALYLTVAMLVLLATSVVVMMRM